MTKLLVISDSHRDWKSIDEVLKQHNDCNFIIHLGDHDSDMDDFPDIRSRLIAVSGNCDPFSMLPGRKIITVEGIKILLSHGDAFGVKRGLDDLAERCAREGCSLGLFGHTHIAADRIMAGVRLINPGALKDGKYTIIEIDGTTVTASPMILG